MYWQREDALILSDIHIGKTAHFRKHGIPMPDDVLQKDLEESLTTMKNDFEQRYNNQEFGRTATKPELHEQQQQQWSLPSWAGINSSHTSTKKNDNNKGNGKSDQNQDQSSESEVALI